MMVCLPEGSGRLPEKCNFKGKSNLKRRLEYTSGGQKPNYLSLSVFITKLRKETSFCPQDLHSWTSRSADLVGQIAVSDLHSGLLVLNADFSLFSRRILADFAA